MNIDAFINWLLSEAGAGWVFGTVSLLALIGSYIRRKRPSYVIVEELERFGTIEVHKDIRDKVQFSFDGKPVANLSQYRARVFNSGTNPIKADKITLEFGESCRIIAASLESSNAGEKIGYRDNKVGFSWDFLNPFSEHRHAIELLILADGELGGVKIRGSGAGWSARQKRLPTNKERRWEIRKVKFSLFIIMAFFYGYFYLMEHCFGIPNMDLSYHGFLAAVPVFAVFAWHWLWVKGVFRRLDRTRLNRH